MLIEITGAGFANKGAELMLNAIIEQISRRVSNVKFVMQPKEHDYEQRSKLGLYQKIYFHKYGFDFSMLGKYIPKKIRARYGMVAEREIDVVMDASGFAYGDQWGQKNIINKVDEVEKFKKLGKRYIFLPQAFGPFQVSNIQQLFAKMVKNADLVYARDRESYNHIVKITGSLPHIRLAPDFTNIMDGRVTDYFRDNECRACLIPNSKMIVKTSPEISKRYIGFLASCYQVLKIKRIKPFFLIHETKKDYDLALAVEEELGEKVTIIEDADPLYIKGIIGSSFLVISSRFHGLVSALSQNVPSLATGWSHKYKMLLDDYGCPELMMSPEDSNNIIEQKIDLITDESSRQRIVRTLTEQSLIQKRLSSQMWDEVITCITG
jgi:polysaccharide pyruvyl transferase WcaK-like protein